MSLNLVVTLNAALDLAVVVALAYVMSRPWRWPEKARLDSAPA